jgi:hypothetical protein
VALVSARLGDTHRAEYELSQALATDAGNSSTASDTIQTYEVLHRRNKVLESLQQAPKYRLQELGRLPDFSELRRDPLFQQLLQKP